MKYLFDLSLFLGIEIFKIVKWWGAIIVEKFPVARDIVILTHLNYLMYSRKIA